MSSNRGGRRGGRGGPSGLKSFINGQKAKLEKDVAAKNVDMFSTATRAPDVDVYLEGTANLLDDLRALVSLKVNDFNIVKGVNNASAISDVNMIDLKLNV